jgi:chemotaxis response regulator CheB
MPHEAIKRGGTNKVLPLNDLAAEALRIYHQQK